MWTALTVSTKWRMLQSMKDKNKKRKNRNKITNNEELIMDNNKIKGEIKVENNKNVVISNNEFMDS